jgi:putative ABC transport system ATP-binding protein
VLHDPTTAVDAVTEAGIAARVGRLREGLTTLVVTTSPAWLARCDQVVLLTPGGCRVAPHTALLGEDAYRELVAR